MYKCCRNKVQKVGQLKGYKSGCGVRQMAAREYFCRVPTAYDIRLPTPRRDPLSPTYDTTNTGKLIFKQKHNREK